MSAYYVQGSKVDRTGSCEWGVNTVDGVNSVVSAIDVVYHQNQTFVISSSFKQNIDCFVK